MTAAFAFALKHWKLIASGLVLSVLLIMLASAKGDARHWHKKFDGEHEGRILDQTAYKLAYADAVKRGAERVERYKAATDTISDTRDDSYEKRIAAARAAQRLHANTQTAADQGRGGGNPVPGISNAANGADGAASDNGLHDPTLIATEQAIQLDELQRWLREVGKVRP